MFVHLHTHSPYSFLDGATEVERLVRRAAELGMPAMALTDHDNLCGMVKFTSACRNYGVRPILGAEVTMEDQSHLTLLALDSTGYSNLCSLLTRTHANGGRLNPLLPWNALPERASGLVCLTGCRKGQIPSLVRRREHAQAAERAMELRRIFGRSGLVVEMQDDMTPDSRRVCADLQALAGQLGVRAVATNNVHHAGRDGYATYDILKCIQACIPVSEPHRNRPLNAERYLKSAAEMEDLFGWAPQVLADTASVALECGDVLPSACDITPRYPVPNGGDDASYLRHLTYKGAAYRYGPLSDAVRTRIEHELALIIEMGYAGYFLMVWDIVRWARRQGIRCTGRGSAADSCVAYCLYLTDVDVISRNLPFARFLVPGKTPDIDIDFPSDKRDDVFRHIAELYGQECVGMVCTFHTFWSRSAVRDVGKALALPTEALNFLAKRLHHSVRADRISEAFDRFSELREHKALRERFELLMRLCKGLAGFPRHIGTHSSGIVISRMPLERIAPLQPSARGITRIWTLDKDDAEDIGAIKFDVLSLGALAAVGDAESEARLHDPGFSYDRIPFDDRETYRMLQAGAAVGTFQFESSAQMSLAVTLHPRHFEDLVAAVALIRPGPIRGNVVRRFVGCRNGWMRTDVLHPALLKTLAKTYGCIVFQEQVNDVVAAMTGCSDAEADKFRKSLTKYDRTGAMDDARTTFVTRAMERHPDLTDDAANSIFDQIEGWSGYGFTEGHAASFSVTGYRTAFLSTHHPAEFFSGIMNHQPMGYYASNTLASEARRRGVRVLPVDINISDDKCRVPDPATIRLGLRIVEGLAEEDIEAILAARGQEPFTSLLDFCTRVVMHRDRLENLLLCGAFDSLHEVRRGLLWRLDETLSLASVRRMAAANAPGTLPLEPPGASETPVAWDVPDFSVWDRFLWTWRVTGVCAECHVLAYMRDWLATRGVMTVQEALAVRPGTRVNVAGINVRPHRPPTRSGRTVLFTQVEDETGLLQATCAGEALDPCTPIFLTSPVVIVRGAMQSKGSGMSMKVEKVRSLALRDMTTAGATPQPPPEMAPELEKLLVQVSR